MKRSGLFVLAILLALAAPRAAAADEKESSVSTLGLISYTVSGGGIVPAGSEGEGLDAGPSAGVSAHYETGTGVVLGVEANYLRSSDDLHTRIIEFGLTGRISPPDYSAAFIQLGLGGYALAYDPDSPLRRNPGRQLRAGGSFGVGFEVVQLSRLAIGASAAYHGIVMSHSDALSYLAVTIDLTYRPYSF